MPANTCWKRGYDRTGLEDADDDACCPECGQRPSWKPYPKIELEDGCRGDTAERFLHDPRRTTWRSCASPRLPAYAPFIKIFVIMLGLLFLGCCLSGWLADLEAFSSSPY